MMLISILSLLTVKPAHAQSTSKPSIPQFSIKLVDNSHDVPAYNTTDPFTGATIIHPQQHIDNKTIELKIKTLEKNEERINNKLKELQTKLKEVMK